MSGKPPGTVEPPPGYYGYSQQNGPPQFGFVQTAPVASAMYTIPQQPYNVNTPTIVMHGGPVIFSNMPITVQCPHCHQVVATELHHHATLVGFLLVGLFTFCCECVQNVEHRCPYCHSCVGTYERFPC